MKADTKKEIYICECGNIIKWGAQEYENSKEKKWENVINVEGLGYRKLTGVYIVVQKI